MPDLKRIHYVTRTTLLKWQTDRFIRTTSIMRGSIIPYWVWWNKFWSKKIHGWFCSHFQ